MSFYCRIFLLLYFIFIHFYVFAQTDTLESCSQSCCNLDQSPAGMMISHVHPKNQWMFSYRYMHMAMKDFQSGTKSVSNDQILKDYSMVSDKMQMNMHMFMAMYGLTSKITLMGMMHYTINSMHMTMEENSQHQHGSSAPDSSMEMQVKTTGLGDLKLYFLYSLLKKNNHSIVGSLGGSLPTGSVQKSGSEKSMYAKERLPYCLQAGSGTFDLLPSLTYLWESDKVAYSIQGSGVIRTGFNKIGYHLGNEFTFNQWMGFRWGNRISSSLRLEGNWTGPINGQDIQLYRYYEPEANHLNYGGSRISGYFGTKFYLGGFLENTTISGEAGLPLIQNLNGIQMKMNSTIHLAINTLF